jgi:hypothetical protein
VAFLVYQGLEVVLVLLLQSLVEKEFEAIEKIIN